MVHKTSARSVKSKSTGRKQKGLRHVIYANHERVHSGRSSPCFGRQVQWLAGGEGRCDTHHRIGMTAETESKVTVGGGGGGGGTGSWKGNVCPRGHVRRAGQRRWREIGPGKSWLAVMDGLCTWLSRHRGDGCPICNNTLTLLSFSFTTWPVTVHSLTEKRVTRVAAVRRRKRRPRYGRFHCNSSSSSVVVAGKHWLGVVMKVGRRGGGGGLSGSGIPRRIPISRRRNAWLTYWRRLCCEQCIQVF